MATKILCFASSEAGKNTKNKIDTIVTKVKTSNIGRSIDIDVLASVFAQNKSNNDTMKPIKNILHTGTTSNKGNHNSLL